MAAISKGFFSHCRKNVHFRLCPVRFRSIESRPAGHHEAGYHTCTRPIRLSRRKLSTHRWATLPLAALVKPAVSSIPVISTRIFIIHGFNVVFVGNGAIFLINDVHPKLGAP